MSSHNLEGVSNGHSTLERRRVPRLCLTSEQFRLKETGKVFSVEDLSHDGFGITLIDASDLAVFPVGRLVGGSLKLGGDKIPVSARVRHVRKDRVGLGFEDCEKQSTIAIATFLDPKKLGEELHPIAIVDSKSVWYHAPSGADLLLKRDATGKLYHFCLFIFGSYVQWEGQWTTGSTHSGDEPGKVQGAIRFETLLLQPDEQLDRGKLDIAKKLVLSSNLLEELKTWCIQQLERAEKV